MRSKYQHGLSMLEVLITIVVMAFGLLGISGLMVKGIDNSTSADLSSRATQAANQMIDAIRANRGNLGNYIVLFTDTATSFPNLDTSSVQDRDRYQWLTTLANLPNGDGDITCVAATSICTINVRFSNCIGALNQTQLDACASAASNIRTLTFMSQI